MSDDEEWCSVYITGPHAIFVEGFLIPTLSYVCDGAYVWRHLTIYFNRARFTIEADPTGLKTYLLRTAIQEKAMSAARMSYIAQADHLMVWACNDNVMVRPDVQQLVLMRRMGLEPWTDLDARVAAVV
jgi:hypothetical protein